VGGGGGGGGDAPQVPALMLACVQHDQTPLGRHSLGEGSEQMMELRLPGRQYFSPSLQARHAGGGAGGFPPQVPAW
jgi:hypothetical protein